MKAGETDLEVGTRVQIQNIKGEDETLNGLIGTVTHPFGFAESGKEWIGIWIEAGQVNMPYGGTCNVKISEVKILSDK